MPRSYKLFANQIHCIFTNKGSQVRKIISGNKKIGSTYPYDIAYNVARINRAAFHNFIYTDDKILEYYNANGIKLIDVKQGYSKCSICVIAENAIITSDKIIAKAAVSNGYDVLHISEGYIKLKGLNYGFIGGCCGLISKEILAVNGDISQHIDYLKIKEFCEKYNVTIYPLHNGTLEDIGSIIPLY